MTERKKHGGSRPGSGRKTEDKTYLHVYLLRPLIERVRTEIRRRNADRPKGAAKWTMGRAISEALAEWLGDEDQPKR